MRKSETLINAVNERENRQIVNKSVAIYNKKTPDQLLLIRVGRVFKLLTISGPLSDIKKTTTKNIRVERWSSSRASDSI